MHDFRSFASLLEQRGELARISREVEPKYELPALMTQLERERKAFIFEHVAGAAFPLIGGLLNRVDKFGLALDNPSPTFDHADLDALIEKAKAAPVPVAMVRDAPVKEVVKKGDAITLHDLPVPTFFEHDSGPFITAAIGIARNPRTGMLNAGFYRTLILDKNTFAINASSLSDLRRFYEHARTSGEPMPIALALGVDPAVLLCAAAKLPQTLSEFEVAGALKGAAIEMTKAEMSDLPVPARAEMVIEGIVDFSRTIENTMGEFAGQYGPESCPVTRVTAITHRRDAMFYSIMAGRNPEHNTIGRIATYTIRRQLAAMLMTLHPSIRGVQVHMDPGLGSMAHVVIGIEKTNDGEPRQIIEAAFKASGGIFPVSRIVKRIIVVDTDVDITNLADVDWATWTRVADAGKFMLLPNMQSWELERCAKDDMRSVRVGIDATMDMADRDKLMRLRTPGAERFRLADYLETPKKRSVA
jgi:2,5-furandicarboxylate decarboxylase 1